jgi:chloramphenicol O-acetyltransferase
MKYEIKKMTPFRVLSMYGYEVMGNAHNMYALVEFDITDIREKLRTKRMNGENISFFGFLLYAIAQTIGENMELNHIRKGKKLYYFDEVDINLPIELNYNGARIPRNYVLRNAAKKSAAEITKEIEDAKKKGNETGTIGEDDEWAQKWFKIAATFPKWIVKPLMKFFSKNPFTVKKGFGTTYVSSVSGFTSVSGYPIPFFGGETRPLAFAIGNLMKKPGVTGNEIKIREYVSMTIAINHDLVDGAPAARFVNRLKERVEGKILF